MSIDLQFKIQNDYNLNKFLIENSYWYKYLNRSSLYFMDFTNLMKEKYGLRTSDKINRVFENINMIGSFLEALK